MATIPAPRRRSIRRGGWRGPSGRALGQPAIAIAAGAALGLCAVIVASAPSAQRPFWILAALAPIVAVLVGEARRLLLALVILDVPIGIDVNLSYRDHAAALGALGGLSVSLTTMAIALLWLLVLVDGRPASPRPRRELRRAGLPLTLYVLITCLSITVARDTQLSTFEIALVAQSALVFAYVATQVRSRSDVRFVTAAMLAGLALEGLIAVGAYAGYTLHAAGLATRVDLQGYARFGGTIGDPNNAGAYFALFLVPALAALVAPVGRACRWLAGCAFALGLFGLATTFSRGGWLGFAVSLAIFCAIGWRRGWFSLRVPAIVVLALAALAIPLGGSIDTRLTASDQGSAASRLPLAKTALNIAEDHPLLGVGANNYTVVLPDYRTPQVVRTWNYTVHDKYLLVLAETGVAGLAAFLWFLLGTVRAGWVVTRSEDRVLAVLAAGFGAAVVGQAVHMAVDTFRGRPNIQGLFLVAGLLTAMSVLVARAGDQEAGNPRPGRRAARRPG